MRRPVSGTGYVKLPKETHSRVQTGDYLIKKNSTGRNGQKEARKGDGGRRLQRQAGSANSSSRSDQSLARLDSLNDVSASAPGFESVTQQHVAVDVLAVATVNLRMQLGAVGDTVTVSSAPPPLDTADSTLGSNMRNELYTALPLAVNGSPRDPTAFVALVPGVQALSTQAAGTSFARKVGGQRGNCQELLRYSEQASHAKVSA
jgi:hypothetical protein